MVYYSHVNTNQNEAGGVLRANKTDFKVGSLTRDKDGCNEKKDAFRRKHNSSKFVQSDSIVSKYIK